MSTLAFPPQYSLLADRAGLITEVWNRWLRAIVNRTQNTPNIMATKSLTAQSAAIAATAFALGTVGAGIYRVGWYARITTAAGTSSSLTITIGSSESGVNLTQSGAAITGNTTTTVQSGVVLLRSAASVSITYATAYTSVGTPAMRYRLDLVCEGLS